MLLIIKRMFVAFGLLAFMIWAIVHLFRTIPTSFVPNEDQGYVLAQVVMPDAASLKRTVADGATRSTRCSRRIRRSPTARSSTATASSTASTSPTSTVVLRHVQGFQGALRIDRDAPKKENVKAILTGRVCADRSTIDTGVFIPIAPPAIPGIGTGSGFEFWIQDKASGDPVRLYEVTQQFLAEAANRPELGRLNTTYRGISQQMRANVDRSKAVLLGVPVADVNSALQAQFGSIVVSQFTQYSRVWNVILQADAPYRESPTDLTKLYTRSTNGKMVPLSAVVTTEYVRGPDLVPHFNGFPAAQVIGSAAAGYSSGDAIKAMQEVAAKVLPEGYGYEWSGMAYQEIKSGNTSAIAFAFGILIVFLILSAMYESWTLPGSVLTAVPFGIIGALLATWARGLENDVYFQIGLLVLVGLAAKNAILIVEFAVELRHQGKSLLDAAVEAGELRLRPIIMTSLAFIFGCVPLAIAMGAGMNARHSLGTGIIGGMIGASTLALLYVPLFFYLFEQLAERGEKKDAGKRRRGPCGPLTGACASLAARRLACSPAAWSARTTSGRRSMRRARSASRTKATPSLADTRWWEQFQDPVLNGLIKTALEENKDVKIAAARVEEFLGRFGVTRAQLFPQVGLQGQGGRQRGVGTRLPTRFRRAEPIRTATLRSTSACPGNWTCGASCAARPRRRAPTCSRPRKTASR